MRFRTVAASRTPRGDSDASVPVRWTMRAPEAVSVNNPVGVRIGRAPALARLVSMTRSSKLRALIDAMSGRTKSCLAPPPIVCGKKIGGWRLLCARQTLDGLEVTPLIHRRAAPVRPVRPGALAATRRTALAQPPALALPCIRRLCYPSNVGLSASGCFPARPRSVGL